MKQILVGAVLGAALALLPSGSEAQVFGQYTPADVLQLNGRMSGFYANISQNVVGALAQLRLSFASNTDFGFQGGLSRVDLAGGRQRGTVSFGADFRIGARHQGEGSPVDLAAGAAIGVESGDHYNVLTLGPSAVVSHVFPLTSNSTLVPYGSLMLAITNYDVPGDNEAEFTVPLRLGAELRPMAGLRIPLELQLRLGDKLNDHVTFSAGVNLPF